MANPVDAIIAEIEAGHLEYANELALRLTADPAICTQETLAGLQKARSLALIQRSHIQRQLRALDASRLYDPPVEAHRATFHIDA